MAEELRVLTREDFDPGVDVRWCPGCGDYSILANVQKILPTFGFPPEQYVFVSGIGCSSRFPYYVNTYGFHSIHGRAPAVATGVKLTNPELKVWIVTGDGDALGIGGNHFIHLLRRNLDVVILLFNNRIYGLTKGQVSPTSELGKVTKSTPHGSTQYPFNPLSLALGAHATFVARSVHCDAIGLTEILREAALHRGTSFVEIYQSCKIFNEHAFDALTDRTTRDENQLRIQHGKPLVFGKDSSRGVKIDMNGVSIVPVEGENWETAGVTVYDRKNYLMAQALATLETDPIPTGVLYQEERPILEDMFEDYGKAVDTAHAGNEYLERLFHSGDTWEEK